jgi:hypothetical protein
MGKRGKDAVNEVCFAHERSRTPHRAAGTAGEAGGGLP